MYANGYRCVACTEKQDWGFDGFVCPLCGGTLDILYDYECAATALGGKLPASGDLFRFAPLLPLRQPRPDFPLHVGGTPLYRARRLGRLAGLSELYLKDDTLNPSASLKDRASAVALARARDIGAGTLSAASTGNAGSSLACLCAATGRDCVVFVPASAPPAKLAQLLAFGARVLAVQGNYDEAYDLCLKASDEFGWFNRSTGYNPFTREGKKTCAYEIWLDLGGAVPDRVVVSTGDGNTLSAIWKGWCDLHAIGLAGRLPKIDCAQSEASAAICNTVRRVRAGDGAERSGAAIVVEAVNASTVADSISVDRPRDGLSAVKAVLASGGEAVTVPDEDILTAVGEMAGATGVFPEPAAAAPWAAVRQMVRDGRIDAGERVVCVVSGSGLKDVDSARRALGGPRLIEPSLVAVRAAIGLP
jgi:threonine synthase